MRSVKDKAIIIRRKSFGEADLMLTLYTEKNGKVRVLAKGARKITSKLLGFTELFTIINCQIDFSTSIPIVSQISHEQLFDGIAENQELYHKLHTLAELIDKGCKEDESDILLYHCLRSGTKHLVTSSHPLVLSSLVMRISSILGFEPEITTCAHCGNPIEVTQPIGWSNMHGGVVSFPKEIPDAQVITVDDLKVLRYLKKASLNDVEKLNVPIQFAKRLERCLLGYSQHVLEEEFVSQRAV